METFSGLLAIMSRYSKCRLISIGSPILMIRCPYCHVIFEMMIAEKYWNAIHIVGTQWNMFTLSLIIRVSWWCVLKNTSNFCTKKHIFSISYLHKTNAATAWILNNDVKECSIAKIDIFEVKLTFEMLTVRGQQHSFSTHERVFL